MPVVSRVVLAVVLFLTLLVGTVAGAAPRVRVVPHTPGLAARADALGRSTPRILERIARDLDGLPVPDTVEIRLVMDASELASVAPPGRGAPAYADAVAWPGTSIVAVAIRGRQGALVDLDRVLAHELAHLALDHALGSERVPRWLTEGFASLQAPELSFERAWTVFTALLGGKLVPIWELDATFPAREDEVHLAYAQAYDFVGFLARRGRHPDETPVERRWAFQKFLSEIGHGAALDDAAKTAWAKSLAELQAEWVTGLRERYFWMPIGLVGTAVWAGAGLLLTLGWLRRRRQMRAALAAWDLAEAREAAEITLLN